MADTRVILRSRDKNLSLPMAGGRVRGSAPASGLPILAHITNSLNPGGVERLVIEMTLALRKDFDVHVFCLDQPGLWASELQQQGVPVSCLWRRPGLDLSLAWKLARVLRTCGADLIHAHQCTPWFYAALSRLFYRRPKLLLEEHGRQFPEIDNRGRQIFNRLIIRHLTHHFVAVSQDMKHRLQRYEGLDAVDIEVIYNGVTTERQLTADEREMLRREWGIGPDHFVVGTVGRFDPVKNLPMLLGAIAAARAENRRIRGLLVGDGPELQPMRGLIASMGLADTVRLAGYRRDTRRFVQCLDLFVLSSFSEGASIALLEAAAAKVPVAATSVGGNSEIVIAAETGWLVPSGAVDALTAVILEAALDPELCARYAQSSFSRLEERFSFDQMVGRYKAVYGSLLGSARAVSAPGQNDRTKDQTGVSV